VALLLDGSTFPLGLNLSTDINLMGRPLLDKLAGSANVFNWAQSRLAAFGHGALTLRVRHQNIRHWRLRQSSGSSAN
jgi:hypothetical protein